MSREYMYIVREDRVRRVTVTYGRDSTGRSRDRTDNRHRLENGETSSSACVARVWITCGAPSEGDIVRRGQYVPMINCVRCTTEGFLFLFKSPLSRRKKPSFKAGGFLLMKTSKNRFPTSSNVLFFTFEFGQTCSNIRWPIPRKHSRNSNQRQICMCPLRLQTHLPPSRQQHLP